MATSIEAGVFSFLSSEIFYVHVAEARTWVFRSQIADQGPSLLCSVSSKDAVELPRPWPERCDIPKVACMRCTEPPFPPRILGTKDARAGTVVLYPTLFQLHVVPFSAK